MLAQLADPIPHPWQWVRAGMEPGVTGPPDSPWGRFFGYVPDTKSVSGFLVSAKSLISW